MQHYSSQPKDGNKVSVCHGIYIYTQRERERERESERENLWMKVREESEKASLKLNIQKTKVMASGPITSWQIDGETMEK